MQQVHFYDEFPLGALTVLPPEIMELVMTHMNPINLVPMMLSSSILYSISHHERIWDKAYQRCMPNTYKALHLAPNPEYWKFRNSSSIKFLYEFVNEATSMDSNEETFEVDTVMAVMRRFPHNVLVQRAVVYVLRRLAYYPQVCDKKYREKIEVFRSSLGENGAIEAAVNVLTRFNEPELLGGALCAIGNLVIDGANAHKLNEVHGVEIIVEIMKRNRDSFTVVDYGCFALCNLGDDYKFKECIYQAGGAKIALEVLTQPDWKPDELTPAIDLLAVLSQVMEVKLDFGKVILDAVNSLLAKHIRHTKLVAHVLTLAVLVCENIDENRDYAVRLRFIEKLFGAMDSFKGDPLLFSKAALVLFTLFWRNDSAGMTAHRSELIRAIVEAMRKHKTDLSLQRTSAAMLSDFAHSDPQLKRLIISLGGKALVQFALSVPAVGPDPDPEWSALAAFISIDD